jgi:hypothetical protein
MVKGVNDMIWAFDLESQSYSRIDFFSSPPRIYTRNRDSGFVNIATPIGTALLGHTIKDYTDSTQTDALLLFDEEGERELFTFSFDSSYFGLVGCTDISTLDSQAVLGYGKAGFAVIGTGASGDPDPGNTLAFRTLTLKDSVFNLLNCDNGEECTLIPFQGREDSIVSVDAVAVDRITSDSIVLLLGSNLVEPGAAVEHRGLRRGLLGDSYFPKVTSLGLDTLPIKRIFINPNNHLIWIFTSNGYYLSDDGGLTFKVPDKPVSIKQNLITSLREPSMAFYGDTSIINFDFPPPFPGLAIYIRDSLIVNYDEDPDRHAHYLLSSLRLPVNLELTGMATAVKDDEAVLAVGTNRQGLFYLNLNDTTWENLNRQTKVEGRLKEVITFPTVFDGTDNVGIGYQLSKSARVTIRIFNYAMEKVRTLVDGSYRVGGSARSENSQEDSWDGKDEFGNYVSTGLYYIQVKSDKGEAGWGKVIVTYARY